MVQETQTFAPLSQSYTRTDVIAQVIKSAILAGKLKPGDSLVERKIADDLGVSKTPVREALITLSQGGLVVLARNKGTFVREMTIQNFIEIYQARLLMEPWAVTQSVDYAGFSQQDKDRALKLLDPETSEAAEAGDSSVKMAQKALKNREFHRLLYENCPNATVVKYLDGLQDLAALGAVTYWEYMNTWEKESDEHEQMLTAAAAGETKKLNSLLTNHIENSIQNIKKAQSE